MGSYAMGGEAVLSYRINKAFSVGIGVNFLRGWFDRRNRMNESSSFFFSLKVSFKEKPSSSPTCRSAMAWTGWIC